MKMEFFSLFEFRFRKKQKKKNIFLSFLLNKINIVNKFIKT